MFAFRKLRERLLMDENFADIYNQKKVRLPHPNKEAVKLSRDQLEGMLKSLDKKRDKDMKAQILDKTNRQELEAMLKHARRQEYYQKRVKVDFAQKSSEESSEPEEQPRGDDSPISPGERRKRQLYKEKK